MVVLVIGAGQTGAHVLRQLQKNPRLKVVTADPREDAFAVTEGIIPAVDILETVTPLTLDHVIDLARPDLVLFTTGNLDLGPGAAAGMDILAGALREEIAAIAKVPVIRVVATASR